MGAKTIPVSAWTAAFVASIVGYAGTAALLVQAMNALGARPEAIGSALTALCIGIAVTGALLSFRLRIPVILAWSTPGAALLASAPAGLEWNVAIGIFVSASAMMIALALIPALSRLAERFPPAIASGVLAGVLLPFCLKLFEIASMQPMLVAILLAVFVVARQRVRTLALLLVFMAGVGVTLIRNELDSFEVNMIFGMLRLTTPAFDLGAVLSVGIPLFLVTLVSQKLPGLAVLRNGDFDAKPATLFLGTGLASLASAFFGGHGINLAAITAAICTSEEAHPDRSKRWIVAVVYAGFYLLMALFSPILIQLFLTLPREVIAVLTGLALVPALSGALETLLMSKTDREAGVLAFLATGSGLSLFGLGAAFWGLAVGLLALAARSFLEKTSSSSRQTAPSQN
jgi:benzoate membrane transport protein